MISIPKKIELLANISIVLVAGLLIIVIVKKNYSVKDVRVAPPQQVNGLKAGTTLSLPGIRWDKQSKTLILALSTACHFCSESGPFYQRLVEQSKKTHLMAVLPQSVNDGKRYLSGLGVTLEDVDQNALGSLGVHATPTLILVDSKGMVTDFWIGKLPADKERDVLSKIE